MRILLTGANGQVGWELQRTLAPLGEVTALDRAAFDLTKLDDMRQTIRHLRPEVLVNAAGYTEVDRAESEPDLAMTVNGIAPGIMAEEMARLGGAMLHYSTDCVFDGAGHRPWSELDPPHPISVYGNTKLAGERAIQAAGGVHAVLRTSWVYGRHGSNFVRTVIRLALERDELRMVADQTGVPTWSCDLARWSASIVERLVAGDGAVASSGGIFHLVPKGQTTWHSLAEAVVRIAPELAGRRHVTVVPIDTADYPLPARRPPFSVLDASLAQQVFGIAADDWRVSLAKCLCAA